MARLSARWRGEAWLAAALWALVALYLLAGLAAMLLLAPRVPYADAWRFLAHFLQASFPWDVLTVDNGHREVFPNLVRVVELHALAASQWLQIAVGMLLAAGTVGLVGRAAHRAALPAPSAAAVTLSATLGIFWLGNVRALAHGNESVHAYLVALCLVAGVLRLARAPATTADAALAGLLGLVAAFSFGSGIACFAAFGVVLALRRAPPAQWLAVGAALALAVVLMLGGGGAEGALRLAPRVQFEQLLRWLGAPWLYAGWPLLDPALAAQVPGVAGLVLETVATRVERAFGPTMLARWPHALLGALGLAWLAVATFRHRVGAPAPVLLGLGLAWFSVAVGGLIALGRLDYFRLHPEQLLAPRYLVWSSLFWAGLALSASARPRWPKRAAAGLLLAGLLLLPSQAWMARLGAGQQEVATRTALAAAVGVLEPGLELGETVPAELAAALPHLRAARASVFAWPEAAWLGRPAPVSALSVLDAEDIEVARVANLLGQDGRRVRFRLRDAPHAGARLLLVDADDVVRGLATRDADGAWLGWMQGGEGRPRVARAIAEAPAR